MISNKTAIRHAGNQIQKGLSLRSKMIIYFGLLFARMLVMMKWVVIYGIPLTTFGAEFRQQQSEVFKNLNLAAGLRAEIQENIPYGMKDNKLWTQMQKEKVYQALTQYLKLIKTTYEVYEQIQVADATTGIIIASTQSTDLGENISREDSFIKALNPRYNEIIDIKRDPQSGEFHLYICHAIKSLKTLDDNRYKVAAILIMHVNPDDFIKPMLHTGKDLGQSGEALLANEDVKILTSLKHPMADGTIARPLEYQIKAKPTMLATQGDEGTIATEEYRDVPVLATFRHIRIRPESGWGMAVKRDKAEVFAPLRKSMFYSSIIGLISILICLGLAVVIANNLSGPLQILSQTAQQVEADDLNA